MRVNRGLAALLAICASLILFLPKPAEAALSCGVTIGNINFGTLNVLAAPTVSTSADVTITCSGGVSVLGLGILDVFVCPSINLGFGSGITRQMLGNPAGTLTYQLFADSGHATIWSTLYGALTFGSVPPIQVHLDGSGNGSKTVQLYAQVTAPTTTLPGSYSAQFTTADVRFDYSQIASVLTCAIGLLNQSTTTSFNVQSQVDAKCTINSDNIAFGSRGLLSSATNAQGRVGIDCTNGTTYTVALNNGLTGTTPTNRLMTKSTQSIRYGLYQNTSRTQAWGNTVGTDTVAGTGTGAQLDIPVYGQVPAQTTPSAGQYSDTVVATVSY